MLAEFLMAFAFAAGGSPSTVVCQPEPLVLANQPGVTWTATRAVELAPQTCAGLLLLGASPEERARIAAANTWLTPDYSMALGALTLAHEAQHTAGVTSEGEAECRATQAAPDLLRRYLDGPDLEKALNFVRQIHSLKPAEYRSVC